MKNLLKIILSVCLSLCFIFIFVSCGNEQQSERKENIELTTAMLGDVEFSNGENVQLKANDEGYVIQGKINEMSLSQKTQFGVDDVKNVVVLKFSFDKEKTVSKFEIKGNVTKVFADSDEVENYVGSLTDLLDNEASEDAYCNLILSAHTQNYTLTTTYSDQTESVVKLKIEATLVESQQD